MTKVHGILGCKRDHPLYADDNVEIECLWNEGDAIPFGYWIGGSGELEFFVGDNKRQIKKKEKELFSFHI